jgi:hypothetical protein
MKWGRISSERCSISRQLPFPTIFWTNALILHPRLEPKWGHNTSRISLTARLKLNLYTCLNIHEPNLCWYLYCWRILLQSSRKFRECMFMSIARSVQRLATGTVLGSNPGGGEIFRTCPDRLWGPPSLLYNGYLFSFPRIKQPGRGVDNPSYLEPRLKKE